jgi:ATP-dependent RNA helicase DeaD
VPVVVGTPGRLLDHLDRGTLDLSNLRMLVLDEADEMLRMGFIDDVETLLAATPKERQVALFSATLPPPIAAIADKHLSNPTQVGAESGRPSTDHIQQQWARVPHRHKLEAVLRLLAGATDGTTLVFARTRAGCAEVADALVRNGVAADALHGDLSQSARERVLARLRAKRLRVVVATDVASRGIDVDHIRHVVNLDMPHDVDTYVHRIGRTGRAGREGSAISLVTPGEIGKIKRFARDLRVTIHRADIPSDAQIATHQQQQLRDRLELALEGDGVDDARQFVEETLRSGDWSAEELAVAAVTLAARAGGTELGTPDDEGQVGWSQDRRGDDRHRDRPERGPRREQGPRGPGPGMVELFFPVGKSKGVRPGDLVGAIANETGLSGSDIGRVTVVEYKSFVEVPEDAADQILADFPTLEIRGRAVPLARAFVRGDTPPPRGARPPRGPRPPRPGAKGRGGGGKRPPKSRSYGKGPGKKR